MLQEESVPAPDWITTADDLATACRSPGWVLERTYYKFLTSFKHIYYELVIITTLLHCIVNLIFDLIVASVKTDFKKLDLFLFQFNMCNDQSKHCHSKIFILKTLAGFIYERNKIKKKVEYKKKLLTILHNS